MGRRESLWQCLFMQVWVVFHLFLWPWNSPEREFMAASVLEIVDWSHMRETLRKLLPAFVDSQLPLTQNNPSSRVAYFRVADSNLLHCLRTLWQWHGKFAHGKSETAALTRAWSGCEWWSPSRTDSSVPWAFCAASVAPSTTGPACSQCWLTLGDP